MIATHLLAIVEVPRDDRVRCQAAGCSHPVFRRIHVVREEGAVRLYGSECFGKLFGQIVVAKSAPRYTSSEGRHLTEEERRLLIENTERLIELFESEYQADIERRVAPTPTHQAPTGPASAAKPATPTFVTPVTRAEAMKVIRAKYPTVNLDLPGWSGLVSHELRKLVGDNAL